MALSPRFSSIWPYSEANDRSRVLQMDVLPLLIRAQVELTDLRQTAEAYAARHNGLVLVPARRSAPPAPPPPPMSVDGRARTS